MTPVFSVKQRLIPFSLFMINFLNQITFENKAMTQLNFETLDDQLIFSSGVFPQVIINADNFSNTDECARWIQQNLSAIELQLEKTGVILFRGFPLDSAETFDAFAEAFNYPSFTYSESLSNAVRINFTERVFTANEAPKEVEIYLHHEMAQTPISPDKLFFFCKSAADSGGATPVCRSDQLFNALKEKNAILAERFKQKGLKYTNYMPAVNDHESGQGRSWKSTLSVENVAQAEEKLAQLGYSWEWLDDQGLKATTPVLPAVRVLENGTEVFYNQLIAAYMGWDGVKDDPSKAITYGDGSHLNASDLQLVVELSKDFTYDLKWQDGDVALIDNKLAMHGRRPYSGERKRQVLVALSA